MWIFGKAAFVLYSLLYVSCRAYIRKLDTVCKCVRSGFTVCVSGMLAEDLLPFSNTWSKLTTWQETGHGYEGRETLPVEGMECVCCL
jgi:hypothetical protein